MHPGICGRIRDVPVRNLLIVAVTIATAIAWLQVLKRTIPYYKDKNLPAGVGTFFLFGLLSIPVLFVIYLLLPAGWLGYHGIFRVNWGYTMLHAFLEEVAKWLIFAVVVHRKKPIRSPEDGVLFAAATALAFAILENVAYAGLYGLTVLLIRSVLTTVGHMSNAAIWGFAWSSLTWQDGGAGNRHTLPLAATALLPAGILHGLYNASLYLGIAAGMVVNVLIVTIAFITYRVLLQHSPYRNYSYRDAPEAVLDLTRALEQNPESIVLRRRRGLYYLRQGRYDNAEADFRHARDRSGQKSGALLFLTAIAVYAQDRDRVRPDQIRAIFFKLPEKSRRALRRQLPQVLRTNRALEQEITTLLAQSHEEDSR